MKSIQINIFKNVERVHLLSFIDLKFSILLRISCLLIFLFIAFRKSFKIVTLVPFLELFWS